MYKFSITMMILSLVASPVLFFVGFHFQEKVGLSAVFFLCASAAGASIWFFQKIFLKEQKKKERLESK